MTELIQIITGFLGSIGFSILFNLRGKKLLIASLGGLLSWTVYVLLAPFIPSEPVRYCICSMCMTVYAEIFARVEKTPTTSFLVSAAIPLIPGSALYYTMNYALNQQWRLFAEKAFYTLELAFFLAVGIIAITTVTRLLTTLRKKATKQPIVSPFHNDI
jgi:uncharacterized membrane protein YjjB (DUF3815 family)